MQNQTPTRQKNTSKIFGSAKHKVGGVILSKGAYMALMKRKSSAKRQ